MRSSYGPILEQSTHQYPETPGTLSCTYSMKAVIDSSSLASIEEEFWLDILIHEFYYTFINIMLQCSQYLGSGIVKVYSEELCT